MFKCYKEYLKSLENVYIYFCFRFGSENMNNDIF